MLTIGLTGGIGSGKTTVTDLFSALGVPIIDADIIARQLVEPGSELLLRIAEQFGPTILDARGQLNRQQLRQLIFQSATARAQLDAIMHPAILAQMHRQASQCNSAYCILSMPLLLETKQQNEVDRVLVVETNKNLRLQRVARRDKIADEQVNAIMASQASDAARSQAADDIISNNADINALKDQVNALHRRYMDIATSKPTEVSNQRQFKKE